MNTKHAGFICVAATALLVTAISLAGCKTSSGERTMGQKMHDREVASAVKKSLSQDPTFKYSEVHAEVYNGNVQLTGVVETEEQRLRAAERAAEAKGAKQVINEIMIRPMPTGRATIRDPLGQDTGRLLVDTNSALPQMRNLPSSTNAPQQ